METFEITVRYNGDTIPLEVDADTTGFILKTMIQQLTNLAVEKQKIYGMPAAKTLLGDDDVLTDLGVGAGSRLICVGALESFGNASSQRAQRDLVETTALRRVGIQNIGNTCFIASILQSLFCLDDFRSVVDTNAQAAPAHSLIRELKSVFSLLKTSETAIFPASFVKSFRSTFPALATRTGPLWNQQDAVEALEELLPALVNYPKGEDIRKLFAIDVKTTFTGDVGAIEPASEQRYVLHMPVTQDTLNVGISLPTAFESERQKTVSLPDGSQQLATFRGVGRLTAAPRYLCIALDRYHHDRFQRRTTKISRKVDFPFLLDVLPVASGALAERMTAARDQQRAFDDEHAEAVRNGLQHTLQTVDNPEVRSMYRLVAVVSHIGASLDSGHYVANCNFPKGKEDRWFNFDDAKVTSVTPEIVQQAAGGTSTLPTAYCLVYEAAYYG